MGIPVSLLLAGKYPTGNCTVTICHSRTENLAEITRQADILVAAIGSPHFIKGDMVKEGAVVIDVGITRRPDASKKSGFALLGDVDYEQVAPKCSYITPGSRWGRSDDHCDVDEKHAYGHEGVRSPFGKITKVQGAEQAPGMPRGARGVSECRGKSLEARRN